MTTFAIIAPSARADLTAAVERTFPNANYEFSPGQFVVLGNGMTAEGVTRALGGANGEFGRIAVFGMGSFWGYHTTALWDWLSARGSST